MNEHGENNKAEQRVCSTHHVGDHDGGTFILLLTVAEHKLAGEGHLKEHTHTYKRQNTKQNTQKTQFHTFSHDTKTTADSTHVTGGCRCCLSRSQTFETRKIRVETRQNTNTQARKQNIDPQKTTCRHRKVTETAAQSTPLNGSSTWTVSDG